LQQVDYPEDRAASSLEYSVSTYQSTPHPEALTTSSKLL